MLKRIYVDNYKCLVNFEYHPGEIQLILGKNGSGKSTLLEVLSLLRAFIVEGDNSLELFPPRSLCRWLKNQKLQTFELQVAGNGGDYQYKLVIENQIDN